MHNDTREPDYTRFTLVDTFARDKSRESREVARTSCYRSPPFDTPPFGGEKSHHSFAPFTFPAAFAFYRIQEWLCKYFKSSKPECAQKLTNSFETSLRGYVLFSFGQRERERGGGGRNSSTREENSFIETSVKNRMRASSNKRRI